MTITSVGYDGSVDEVDWASLSRLVGTDGGVLDNEESGGDFLMRINGTGTRPVTVGAGKLFGSGVMDVNSADAILNPAALSVGTRWDTLVMDRNWSTNTSQLAIRTGTSTKQITRSFTTPGVREDQPIGLLFLDAAFAQIQQIIDLRTRADKIRAFATAEGLKLLTPDGWAFARDTLSLWHGEVVLGTPTWVDTSKPVWKPISQASSLTPSGLAPRYARLRSGLVVLQGGCHLISGANFIGGNTYSLGQLDAGYRPAGDLAFNTVITGVDSSVVVTVAGPGGAITASPRQACQTIRLDGISFPADV